MARARQAGRGLTLLLLKRWLLAFLTPRPLIGVLYLPRYIGHWFRFSAASPPALQPQLADSYPCLTDWVPATPFDPHYFHQGAWLARCLQERNCLAHVDVGSSVMMVGVMSAHVPTVFLDFRPLQVTLHNLLCVAGDILHLPFADKSVMSLSSLHVIEHIGLGRYGDPLNVQGSIKAAHELARVLAPGGVLYVSVPTGRDRVCFNAHRVFSPDALKAMFAPLVCTAFALVDDAGRFHPQGNGKAAAQLEYGCGMYVFSKS